MRMAFIVVENVRGFFTGRPPLVVFMICLASFAVVLITFAYFVKAEDIQNIDSLEDWNTFLEKFSSIGFCLPQNVSAQNSSSSNFQGHKGQHEGRSMVSLSGSRVRMSKRSAADASSAHPTSQAHSSSGRTGSTTDQEETSTIITGTASKDNSIVNITLAQRVKIVQPSKLLIIPTTATHFGTSITGEMLGISGKHGDQGIQVTISFPDNLSQDMCEMRGDECTLEVQACVTFSSPAYMLPNAIRPVMSDLCIGVGDPVPETGFRNMTATLVDEAHPRSWCPHGVHIQPVFSFDDSLTVFLSAEDRSVINLHLMRTSYFLFVMVVTMFCYAMIKGRPGKIKAVHMPYEKVATQP